MKRVADDELSEDDFVGPTPQEEKKEKKQKRVKFGKLHLDVSFKFL
jgi:hypothetical protein